MGDPNHFNKFVVIHGCLIWLIAGLAVALFVGALRWLAMYFVS